METKGWIQDWEKKHEEGLTQQECEEFEQSYSHMKPETLARVDASATKKSLKGRVLFSKAEVKVKGDVSRAGF